MIKELKIVGILSFALILGACGKEVAVTNNSTDNGMGEFLPVEEAFVFTIDSIGNDTIKAHWEIADGYYLYKDKLEFSLGNEDYQIAALDMPKGRMIEDKVFGNKESFEGSMDVNISLKAVNATGKVVVTTGYQGCSAKGLCYPPQSVEVALSL